MAKNKTKIDYTPANGKWRGKPVAVYKANKHKKSGTSVRQSRYTKLKIFYSPKLQT